MLSQFNKDEVLEELEHQRRMVKELRRRRRLLEHTHALKGIETDAHILIQIEDLTQHITERETEIAHLQTAAVEDKESVIEVEYRVAVAETFDTLDGMPSVAGQARLELLRLRLGIPKEQAESIERVVRAAIVVRCLWTFTDEELDVIREIAHADSLDRVVRAQCDECVRVCKKIERSFHLDQASTVGWCVTIKKPHPDDLQKALEYCSNYLGHFTQQTLRSFIRKLKKAAEADGNRQAV